MSLHTISVIYARQEPMLRRELVMSEPSNSEIFMGMGHERQEWPLLTTAQVWIDNFQELKRRGVMTEHDLRELEHMYGKWAAHFALAQGDPMWRARHGYIGESKRAVFVYAKKAAHKT
jgi:hypothetical protein